MGIEFNPNEKPNNVNGDNQNSKDEKLLDELKEKKKDESIFNKQVNQDKVNKFGCGYCQEVC